MKIKWNEARNVAGAGAVGGVSSLVYSIFFGNPPPVSTGLAIPLYTFFGAVAAILAVYLIARTDTKKAMHCLAFAIACGFSWAPVIHATDALIRQTIQRQREEMTLSMSDRGQQLASKLPDTSNERLSIATKEASRTAVDLIAISGEVQKFSIMSAARLTVAQILEALRTVFPRNPDPGGEAFFKIAKAAIQNNDRELAYSAVQRLADVVKHEGKPELISVLYRTMGDIAVSARSASDIQLAFDTRILRAQTVLGAGKSAIEKSQLETLMLLPLMSAKKDMIDSKKFYESLEEREKVEHIEQQIGEINKVIKKLPNK